MHFFSFSFVLSVEGLEHTDGKAGKLGIVYSFRLNWIRSHSRFIN